MSSVDMPSQCRAASRNAKGGDKRLADGAHGGRYYDVHGIENMRHALTILAYEMNGGAGQCSARCAFALALRERVGLQDGQVDHGDRIRSRLRRSWRGPRRLQ